MALSIIPFARQLEEGGKPAFPTGLPEEGEATRPSPRPCLERVDNSECYAPALGESLIRCCSIALS